MAAKTALPPARASRVAVALVHAVSAVVTLGITKPPREREALFDEAVTLAIGYLERAGR